jgi:hypothetical protein
LPSTGAVQQETRATRAIPEPADQGEAAALAELRETPEIPEGQVMQVIREATEVVAPEASGVTEVLAATVLEKVTAQLPAPVILMRLCPPAVPELQAQEAAVTGVAGAIQKVKTQLLAQATLLSFEVLLVQVALAAVVATQAFRVPLVFLATPVQLAPTELLVLEQPTETRAVRATPVLLAIRDQQELPVRLRLFLTPLLQAAQAAAGV